MERRKRIGSKGFFCFVLLLNDCYSKLYGAAAVGSAIVHIVVALKGRVFLCVCWCFVCLFVVECIVGGGWLIPSRAYALVSTAGADFTFVASADPPAAALPLPLPLPLTGPNGCATSSWKNIKISYYVQTGAA